MSAGIDLALWLAGKIAGRERAEAIQLTVEYDPHPPFDAGHMSKACKETQKLAKQMMDERMPPDQRRLVPKIAWRRFIAIWSAQENSNHDRNEAYLRWRLAHVFSNGLFQDLCNHPPSTTPSSRAKPRDLVFSPPRRKGATTAV